MRQMPVGIIRDAPARSDTLQRAEETPMRFDDGQTILFTGDSITDCDRAHPIGAGGGLGNGYVSLVDGLLSVWYPQRVIRVLNSAYMWGCDGLDFR